MPTEPDVYRVGALHDLFHFVGRWRHQGRRAAVSRLLRDLRKGWRRRSYWNGFLAEADEQVGRCGHGWTRKRALRSLARALATRHWAQHECGTVRLATDETRYCVTCDVSTRRGWTKVADYVPAPAVGAGPEAEVDDVR